MFEKLKELYYKGEEKWYAFWDKVNEHLPVYTIIDKVDAIVPSFVLFLILILFLLLFIGFFFFAQTTTEYNAELTFVEPNGRTKVIDSVVTLKITQNDNTIIPDTNYRTDSDGKVILDKLKYGQVVEINVNLSKGTYNGTLLIDQAKKTQTIVLEKKIDFSSTKRTITVKDSFGMTIFQPIAIDFWCENRAVRPTPESGITSSGVIEVTEPYDCVKLNAMPNSSNYEKKTYTINSNFYDMTLLPYEAPKTELKVKVRNNGNLVSETNFTITVSGSSIYTGKTLSSSEAIISVIPGTYTITASDPSGKYATKTQTNVNVETKKEITLEVTKEIRARINIKTIDLTTKSIIKEAIVSLKNPKGNLLAEQKTDNFGTTIFPITDIESYQITAKKPGDLNGGYYAKTIDLNSISSDTNIILELEKITISNAGKTKVRVVDQDLKPVSNAKIILKYKEDDSIVELNQSNNWAMTDVNGYVTFLAGKVEGLVYAYALKYPFSGASEPKLISIDKENEFLININIGEATIKIDLKDEAGQKIDGTARILLTSDNSDLSGLMSIEQGTVQRKIKAGQQVYLAIQSDTFENYITEPRMLFPDKTYTFTVTMKKQINEPKITLDKVYNENDIITRTLQAGKKYYAKLIIESDEKYPEVVTHFRVGKEKLLENDFIEIDKVEGAGIYRETRGTSFDPERGYDYDGENLTDGYAKWINTEFKDFEKGIRVIKIWFNVKRTAPANKELQFFYKAKFGDKKDPPTTNIDNELYDDAKPSNIYYVGEEATCEEAFCITSESLYWIKEDLYINAPYEVKQAEKYNYKYQLMNNSGTDYGTSVKNMTLILTLLNGDKEPIRVMDYQIKDGTQEKGGSNLTNPSSTNLGSFNKDTAVDLGFIIEGNEVGASAIKLELKVDGVIIYTRESTFSVPSEKELQVKINPSFVPSLANTELVVEVSDDKGEPVNKADVKIYAKEMGIDEYLIDSSETNRVGKTVVNSGAHYQKTRLILEVTKEGFARKRLTTVISEEIVAFNPESTAIALNTISKREDSKKITIGNQTTHELKIVGIKYDTKFNDIINEQAMKAHSDLLIGTIIPAEEMIELELLKVRLVNSITQNNFIEPITLKGDVIITFQIPSAGTVYDKKLELTINVSSEANADASCLIINNATQTKTTQLGQVTFSFELLNACSADERDIDIDSIYATFSGELKGSAQLSLTSPTSGNSGRSALDGAKRKIYDKVLGGEKLIGTVTYTPSEEAIGSTETLTITLDGKFQGRDIKTSPGALNFSVNVLNLQECMTISSDSSPIAIDETAAITIDASNCLGQTIEVALCRNDAGCSGGKDVEGKITLSKRNLTLKSTSETINAYSPTIPGSYGVTVYARVKGKSSYVYIGETPVTFKEDEDKYFKLSKYDLMIVGDGSEDIILLTNEMLTQDVRVKANECLWGKKDADWGATEYLTVLSTAVIGASLGKTIGENFNKDRTSTVKSDGTTEAERETMTQRANEQMSTLGDGDSGYFYENPDTGDIMMTTQPVNDPSYDFRARVDVTETELGTTYSYSGLGTNQSFSNSNAASAHAVNEISSSSGLHTMVWAWGNNAPTAQTNSIPPVIRDEYGAVAASTIWEAYRSTQKSEV
ncbi:MAG TPA: hypothetical protein PKK60_04325, partial [archaeon]|nr:hypothetical protein [archaeon]